MDDFSQANAWVQERNKYESKFCQPFYEDSKGQSK